MAGAPDLRCRRRIELVLRVSAPALDLALAGADRLSRLLHRGDPGPVPVRTARPGEAAPRGLGVNR
jgi:hypothetical protein